MSPPISERRQGRTERENEEYQEAFGIRIRLVRTARRLTQDDLAVRAGVTRNYVSSIERGKQSIDLVRLRRIADALDVPLPSLVADDVDLIALVLCTGPGGPSFTSALRRRPALPTERTGKIVSGADLPGRFTVAED